MDRLFRPIHTHSRLLAAVALAGAVALVGVETFHALHLLGEDPCTARESGDPFDCYICSTLLRIGLDLPMPAALPALQPGELLAPPDAEPLPPARLGCLAVARAPPIVLS